MIKEIVLVLVVLVTWSSTLPTNPYHLQPSDTMVLFQPQPLVAVPVLPTTRTNQEALAAAESSWHRGGQHGHSSGWKNHGQSAPHSPGGYRPGFNYGGGAQQPHYGAHGSGSGWKRGGYKWG